MLPVIGSKKLLKSSKRKHIYDSVLHEKNMLARSPGMYQDTIEQKLSFRIKYMADSRFLQQPQVANKWATITNVWYYEPMLLGDNLGGKRCIWYLKKKHLLNALESRS